ncbi:hypothetical protein EH228_14745 [Erwinia endophytica]|uniref:hypothetical protein n=1 Tax=Erwinia endophytica TaxID=1563158 RepID=UPI001265FCDC|nr:hypothetical protein [Erwinia endophytica]KAB8307259.1 hypothetical protein EH228_14745 [Erwinia endophytica]
MSDPLMMGRYHEAVIGALQRISWVRDADTYPEKDAPKFSGLVTPAVYFELNEWTDNGGTTGQLEVTLDCDLYVVVDAAGAGNEKPAIFLRAAAADLTQWINGQQFGLSGVEPATFIAATKDEFDPRMDDYLVWRITFNQNAAFGEDPFASTGQPLKQAWLGIAPDIGQQHVDDYRLIWEADSDG